MMKQRKGFFIYRQSELKRTISLVTVGLAKAGIRHQPINESFTPELSLSLSPNHRRAIEEETIAINHDCVYNQTCRLSRDSHVITNFLYCLTSF